MILAMVILISASPTWGGCKSDCKDDYESEVESCRAIIMVTFYSQIAYPLVTVFYWAKHNLKGIFDSTLDRCTL